MDDQMMAPDEAGEMPLPQDIFNFSNQGAIVTGAAGGIGRSTAQLLAAAGAKVLCVDVSENVDETARLISASGGIANAYRADISIRSEVEAMVGEAVNRFGRLDILVNNAAIISTATVAELSEEELDRILSVNLKGTFLCCQAGSSLMAAQGSGSIINVASSAIDSGVADRVAYSMSKAAVAQLTKCLASELGDRNVRVNTVSPGFVVTPMTSRHFADADGIVDEAKKAQALQRLTSGQVLKRTGEPVDIAYSIAFLASPAARFITGQIIRPNGGGAFSP